MIVPLIEKSNAIGLEISLESVRKCAEALLVAIEQARHQKCVARRITIIIALAHLNKIMQKAVAHVHTFLYM